MPKPDPYKLLARVYDTPDHDEITRAFLARAKPLIDRRPRGTWVLDVACGTGVMAQLLQRQRVRVIGVDGSEPMLAIARKRCGGGGARFVKADLTKFTVDAPCSVATACGDVANHFSSAIALEKVFRRVRQQLQPGGVFLFETLRRFCFEAYWAERTYYMEGPGGDLVMECDWDPRLRVGTARMIGYAKDARGSYTKFETELEEYHHSETTLRKALRAAGFRGVESELWSPWPDQNKEPDMDRLFWTARKP